MGAQKRKKQFILAMMKVGRVKSNDITKRIDEVESELGGIERTLAQQAETSAEALKVRGHLQTRALRLRGYWSNLCGEAEAYEKQLLAGYAVLYDKLLSIPRIRKVRIDRSEEVAKFVIETMPQFGQSVAGTWHRIGRFRIYIDLNDPADDTKFPRGTGKITSIRWINLEGQQNCKTGPGEGKIGEWQSPMYIDKDGFANCFGPARTSLKDALLDGDWLTAVKIVVRYPECRGQSNAIRHWPQVPECNVPSWYLETKFQTYITDGYLGM